MVGVLGWILFGLVVGIVAKLLMPGRDPGGAPLPRNAAVAPPAIPRDEHQSLTP